MAADIPQWLPYGMAQQLIATVINENNTTTIAIAQQTRPKPKLKNEMKN